MKKELKIIEVDNFTFKRLKKNKRTFFVVEKNVIGEGIKENKPIILKNVDTKKEIKTKIKGIYTKQNLDKFKTKYVTNFDLIKENNDDKLIILEFKVKRTFLIKLLFLFLMIFIIVWGYFFINDVLIKSNNNKLKEGLDKVSSEITYVIVEINPKLILELRDGKVISSGCLNDDCVTIFKDLDLTNSSLKEATKKLYAEAKNNNIDVSNGVTIFSTNSEVEREVHDIEYVKYNKIDRNKEKEYIKDVIDNKEIKNEKHKNDVSNDLLNVYKKDKDYNKLYECRIIDSEVACYITEEFESILSQEEDTLEGMYRMIMNVRKFENILDKFGFYYESTGIEGTNESLINRIVVNDINYGLFGGITMSTTEVSAVETDSTNMKTSSYNTIGITIEQNTDDQPFRVVVLPISKLNLVTKSYDVRDLVILTAEDGLLVINYNR